MSLLCRSLPCRSLPCRSLPSRALCLIREYSRPITRPDWRQSKPIITPYELYMHIKELIDLLKNKRLFLIILYNILDTEWFYAYSYIKCYGYKEYDIALKYNLL